MHPRVIRALQVSPPFALLFGGHLFTHLLFLVIRIVTILLLPYAKEEKYDEMLE